jgi:hypothetical protein
MFSRPSQRLFACRGASRRIAATHPPEFPWIRLIGRKLPRRLGRLQCP